MDLELTGNPSTSFESVLPDLGEFEDQWNRLAIDRESPFLTHEWLTCWWRAFGRGEPAWLVLPGPDGALRAGAFLERRSRRALLAPANDHSGEWDALAADPGALLELWAAIAELGADQIAVRALPERGESAQTAATTLRAAGFRIVRVLGPFSPELELPSTWEALLESVSGKLRKSLRYSRRTLEREGHVATRISTGGAALDADIDAFLKIEASGWKSRDGTAIISQPATERLYREFAHAAAAQGWLRLYFLEVDGVPVAADYGCVLGSRGLLLKTGFDEAYGRFSPGLILRADAIRASIEEGLRSYDMLGGPDKYKLRWTSAVHPRVGIWAYRGPKAMPAYAYRAKVRPWLKSTRDAARRLRPRTR